MFAILLALAAQTERPDRTYEGDWYVSDDTDNNTGERKVYAFQTYLKKDDPNYVTLTMRCTNGEPTFFVEWHDVTFPDQAVLSLGAVGENAINSPDKQYIFQKSTDTIERGLRASPETSKAIVREIGSKETLFVTAHLARGSKFVSMDVKGTQQAWSRVSRHCPLRRMARPPL